MTYFFDVIIGIFVFISVTTKKQRSSINSDKFSLRRKNTENLENTKNIPTSTKSHT